MIASDDNEIRKAIQRDRQFICAQLSLYKPDYVICCGTIDFLFEAKPIGVYQVSEKDWKLTRRGVWYTIVDGTPYIAYNHPQARIRGNFLHYGLIDTVAELAEKS